MRPAEAIIELHWFGIASLNPDRECSVNCLNQHLRREIALADDILDASAPGIDVPNAVYDDAQALKYLRDKSVREGEEATYE